jgi:imidazolonepropionase-like amidohydrolase
VKGLLTALVLVGVTVFTGEGPPLENASVVIDGNRIAAVGTDVELPENARLIDLNGAVVTPGLIDAASRLGVDEVSLEVTAMEAILDKNADPVRAALRVADTYNPAAVTIPVARSGGITSAVIMPAGGLISGQSIWVDLIPEEPIRQRAAALHIDLTAGGDKPGSRSRKFLRLREVLEDARLYRANRGPYITRKLREVSVSAADLEVLEKALDRELRVVIEVDRAADIRTVLGLVREHHLDAVLLGVAEGWVVAQELAKAGVPVLLDPLQNLPSSFDTLRSRPDNALLLHEAGVEIAFTLRGESHRAHRLRFAAGNAVAEGLPHEVAVEAITRAPARIFDVIDGGSIRVGALANLVVWNGDPLEVGSWPTHLFIRGRPVELRSRQDLLTERYR